MFFKLNKGAFSRLAVVAVIVAALVVVGGVLLWRKPSPRPPEERTPVSIPVVVKPVKKPVKPPVERPGTVRKPGTVAGRIAIVIDDWGYNNSHCKYLSLMTETAGVAILPALAYSRDIIKCATQYGKQPMLHLPLEPYNSKDLYQKGYVLTTEMGEASLRKTANKILDEMKGVAGVNNHTGSKGSENELVMATVLTETRKRGLFFVDSMTSDRSVGGKVAARLKMHIARRDVFLDNRNERVYIERQFAETAQVARVNGYALAIGHDRALTLQIIIEQMKKLTDQGYEFISPAEYIKKNEYPRH
ncbi:MAG: divergent polysaccharide deacetylase family protein [Candidatus Omnitrophica bacterium]|nr:divergent polysaccharide deacetylase family protein [Candidatus Omnitrophota bacterium]